MRLASRRAVVTGGGSGIGRADCEAVLRVNLTGMFLAAKHAARDVLPS